MSHTKDKQKNVFATMKEKFSYLNVSQSPKVEKVIVSVGVGSTKDKKKIETIIDRLTKITGQKPLARPAKKSIATFKLREGQTTGIVVTLRGKRAEDFLTRLIRIALPRTRDFRGIKLSALDSGGNLNIGIMEQTVFPETSEDPTGALFGFQVNVVTTARNRKEGEILFRGLGFPLAKEEESA